MKKTISVVFCVALLAVSFAANAATQANGKDARLLYVKNSADQLYSLPEKITKLKVAIMNGETAYTQEEIQMLKSKLNEAESTLRSLEKPGK